MVTFINIYKQLISLTIYLKKLIDRKDDLANTVIDFIEPIFVVPKAWLGNLFVDAVTRSMDRTEKTRGWIRHNVNRFNDLLVGQIPNLLTSYRVYLAYDLLITGPYAPLAYYIDLLVRAIITDYLDGILARRYKAITRWGQVYDPLADKLLALSAIIVFWPHFWIWNVTACLVLESILLLLGLTVYLFPGLSKPNQSKVQLGSNKIGQLKYNVQGIVLLLFVLNNYTWGNWVLIFANLCSLGSIYFHLNPKLKNLNLKNP